MFALGVDPGLSRCGYGAVVRVPGGLEVARAGVIRTPPSDPLASRLCCLFAELRQLLAETRPDVVVVERVLFQANARTAMGVGQASGVALVAAVEAGCPVVQYSPNEVKQAVTGYGSAGKDQVQRMVQALLHLADRPRPPDVADALALAVCHLTGTGLRAAVAAAGAGSAERVAAGGVAAGVGSAERVAAGAGSAEREAASAGSAGGVAASAAPAGQVAAGAGSAGREVTGAAPPGRAGRAGRAAAVSKAAGWAS